jgi:uncharacterized protein
MAAAYMGKLLSTIQRHRWLTLSSLYLALILVIGGYVNYTQLYDATPTAVPGWPQVVFWASLYLPLLILPLLARWPPVDFGLTLNLRTFVTAMVLVMAGAAITVSVQITRQGAFFEAFARTGEEVFFRGFVFLLLLKLFQNKSRPWLWAVLGSSLLFALVHTQTFQPTYFGQYDWPSAALFFRVIERLFNVFLIAVALAWLRHWTGSILPAVIVHTTLSGGIAALLISFGFFGIMLFLVHIQSWRIQQLR